MNRILWCGGSHLATAKKSIEKLFSTCVNDYYITAAPKNRDWSKRGGRYFVKGCIIGDNAAEPGKRIDLAIYNLVVFVGQYIQPWRYANSYQPMSAELQDVILKQEDLFVRLPSGIYNEPIRIIPKIARCPCILLCDPWVCGNAIPSRFMEQFKISLNQFGKKNNIMVIYQPDRTLNGVFNTQDRFKIKQADNKHFDQEFWDLYLSSMRRIVYLKNFLSL